MTARDAGKYQYPLFEQVKRRNEHKSPLRKIPEYGPFFDSTAKLVAYIISECKMKIPLTTGVEDAGYRAIFCRGTRAVEVYNKEIDEYAALVFLDSLTRRSGNLGHHTLPKDEQVVLDAAEAAPADERPLVRLAAKAVIGRQSPSSRNREILAGLTAAREAFEVLTIAELKKKDEQLKKEEAARKAVEDRLRDSRKVVTPILPSGAKKRGGR